MLFYSFFLKKYFFLLVFMRMMTFFLVFMLNYNIYNKYQNCIGDFGVLSSEHTLSSFL